MAYEQNANETITTEFNHHSDIGVLALEITPPIPWAWKAMLNIAGELHLMEITGVAHVWFWPAVLAANVAHQTAHDPSPRLESNLKLRKDTVRRISDHCKVFVMQNTDGNPHYFVVLNRSNKTTLNSLNSNVNYRKPITGVETMFTMQGVTPPKNMKILLGLSIPLLGLILQIVNTIFNLSRP